MVSFLKLSVSIQMRIYSFISEVHSPDIDTSDTTGSNWTCNTADQLITTSSREEWIEILFIKMWSSISKFSITHLKSHLRVKEILVVVAVKKHLVKKKYDCLLKAAQIKAVYCHGCVVAGPKKQTVVEKWHFIGQLRRKQQNNSKNTN